MFKKLGVFITLLLASPAYANIPPNPEGTVYDQSTGKATHYLNGAFKVGKSTNSTTPVVIIDGSANTTSGISVNALGPINTTSQYMIQGSTVVVVDGIAGDGIQEGYTNIKIGLYAGNGCSSVTPAHFCLNSQFIGDFAGGNSSDTTTSTIIGDYAGYNLTGNGALDSLIIGYQAYGGPYSQQNVCLGPYSCGGSNPVIGNGSFENTAVGAYAAPNLSTGTQNTCVGTQSCTGVAYGVGNTNLGYASGPSSPGGAGDNNNISVGNGSGGYRNDSHNNISIGYSSNTSRNNRIEIGYQIGSLKKPLIEGYMDFTAAAQSSVTINGLLIAGAGISGNGSQLTNISIDLSTVTAQFNAVALATTTINTGLAATSLSTQTLATNVAFDTTTIGVRLTDVALATTTINTGLAATSASTQTIVNRVAIDTTTLGAQLTAVAISTTNLASGSATTYVLIKGSTMTGALNMGSNLINSVANPVSLQDAATKNYVDTSISGIELRAPVRLATTAALPANSYNNGSSGVGAFLTGLSIGTLTIDGYAANVGDRVLINNEATPADNGIYTVTQNSTLVVYILTRATDADQASEMPAGVVVYVTSGTTNLDTQWAQISSVTTVGTDAINFTLFSDVQAGAGLVKSGNTISISNTQSSSMTFTASAFSVGSTSFTVSGGSVTVGYRLTAGSFLGVSGATETTSAALLGVGTIANPLAVNSSSVAVLTAGLVPNFQIDATSVTKQGNVFNGNTQLVQTNGSGQLPAIDGSLLTGISSTFNGGAVANTTIFYATVAVHANAFSVGVTTLVASGGLVGIGGHSNSWPLSVAYANSGVGMVCIGSNPVNTSAYLGSALTVVARSNTNGFYIANQDAGGGSAGVGWLFYPLTNGTGTDLKIAEQNASALNDRITFQAGGNVGIGTTNPGELLEVMSPTGSVNYTAEFTAGTGAGNSFGLDIKAGTNSSDAAMRIDDVADNNTYFYVRGDGNVGINNSSPQQALDVTGTIRQSAAKNCTNVQTNSNGDFICGTAQQDAFVSSQAFSAVKSATFTLVNTASATITCDISYLQNTSVATLSLGFNADVSATNYYYDYDVGFNATGPANVNANATNRFVLTHPANPANAATLVNSQFHYTVTNSAASTNIKYETGYFQAGGPSGANITGMGIWLGGPGPTTAQITVSAGTMTGIVKCFQKN